MFLLIPLAAAATITVGTDAPTLQDAVQSAASGDTIVLPAGTWPGCVRSTKSIEIRGAGHIRTIVEASGCEDAFFQSGGELSMRGLALTNTDGRGLRVENASLILQGVHVNNSGTAEMDGGALHLRDVDAMVTDFQASGCRAQAGGALHVSGGSLTLVDMVLTANQAEHGGAVMLTERAEVSLSIGRFENNEATAGQGGALHVSDGVQLDDSGSFYTGNRAATDGGAIAHESGGRLTVENLTLSANQAPSGRGGAVFVDGVSAVSVLASSFSNGHAQHGGGMFVSNVAPGVSIRESSFSENRATASGGGLAADASGEIRLAGGQFTGNQAADGGGISLNSSSARLLEGIDIAGNRATNGGGVHAQAERRSVLNMETARIHDNQAAQSGGGVAVRGFSAVRLLNTTLENNTAQASGSIAAFSQIDSVAVSDTQLCGIAATDGTLLMLQDVQSISILRSTLPFENKEDLQMPSEQVLVWSDNRVGCADGTAE